MTRHPTLRRGVPRLPGDGSPQCRAVTWDDEDGPTRCSHRAEPAHDWHSGSGVGLVDGEVFGVAWRTLPALPAGAAQEDRP